jgi:hypothetical protein
MTRKTAALPFALLLGSGLLLAGCESQKPENQLPAPNEPAPQAAPDSAVSPAPPPTSEAPAANLDAWLGKWIGPEGTFLVLSKAEERYQIQIQSLDSLDSYEATPAGDHLELQRNGSTETLRAGTGQDTGMKWLLDKKDCLVIREGEGFCRD